MPIFDNINILGGITLTADRGELVTQLDIIAAYLRNYLTLPSTSGGLRTPNFYEYRTDGNQFHINDGGDDMFDGGNYTAPALISNTTYLSSDSIPNPPALSYAVTTAAVTDTDFNYVSLGYLNQSQTGWQNKLPLTMIGTRTVSGNPIGFQKAGNIGADGGGSIVRGDLYTGQIFNGFTTHAWYRQTFGQNNDPAICDLYILLGHPAWNSVFGTVEDVFQSGTSYQGGQYRTFGAGTQNILAITSLLSRPGVNITPRQISASDIQVVVRNYTYLIGQALNI